MQNSEFMTRTESSEKKNLTLQRRKKLGTATFCLNGRPLSPAHCSSDGSGSKLLRKRITAGSFKKGRSPLYGLKPFSLEVQIQTQIVKTNATNVKNHVI